MNASTFLSAALQQSAQMSLVILLVALVAGTLCRRRPHWAYALWMLALLKCLTPPLWSSATSVFSWAEFLRATPAVVAPVDTHADAVRAPLTVEHDRVSPAIVDAERAETARVDVEPPNDSPAWYGQWTISPAAAVLAVWCLGIGIVTLRLAIKGTFARRMLQRAMLPARADLEKLSHDLSARLGIRRRTRVVLLSEPWGPALVGMFHTRLVIPAALVETKTSPELLPIVAHELIHLRRGDHLIAFVQLVAQSVWWFNPLVWWMNREINRCREMCCDEEVVASLGLNPGDYAQTLVDVMRLRRQLKPLAFAQGMSPLEVTTARLRHIMADSWHFHRRAPVMSWLFAALAALALLPGAGWALSEEENEAGRTAPPAGQGPSTARDSSDDAAVFGFTVATEIETNQDNAVAAADSALEWTIVDGGTKQPLSDVDIVVEHVIDTASGRKLLNTTRHKTDADGKARIEVPPAEAADPSLGLVLQGSRAGYAPLGRILVGYQNLRLYQVHGTAPWYQVQSMHPGEEVTGVIVDNQGKPVADLPVNVYSERGKINARSLRDAAKLDDDEAGGGTFVYTADGQFVSSSTEVRTDGQGRFRANILKDGKGVLSVRPGQFAAMSRPITAGADLGTLQLERGVRLRGRVVDTNGKPVAGAWVNMTGGDENQNGRLVGQTSRAAQTSSNGDFELEPVLPGKYGAHVSGQNEAASLALPYSLPTAGVFEPIAFEVTADQAPAPLVFRAVPHAVIRIDFVDGAGQPATGGDVVIEGRRGRLRWSRVMRGDAQGKIAALVPRDLTRVKVSPVGDERIAIRTRTGNATDWQFTSRVELPDLSEKSAIVHVQKRRTPLLWLTVQDGDGGDVPNGKAKVAYDGPDEQTLQQLIRPEIIAIGKGRWRTVFLQPEMPFTVTIEAPGKKPVTRQFKLAEGDDQTVEIKLEADPS